MPCVLDMKSFQMFHEKSVWESDKRFTTDACLPIYYLGITYQKPLAKKKEFDEWKDNYVAMG